MWLYPQLNALDLTVQKVKPFKFASNNVQTKKPFSKMFGSLSQLRHS